MVSRKQQDCSEEGESQNLITLYHIVVLVYLLPLIL